MHLPLKTRHNPINKVENYLLIGLERQFPHLHGEPLLVEQRIRVQQQPRDLFAALRFRMDEPTIQAQRDDELLVGAGQLLRAPQDGGDLAGVDVLDDGRKGRRSRGARRVAAPRFDLYLPFPSLRLRRPTRGLLDEEADDDRHVLQLNLDQLLVENEPQVPRGQPERKRLREDSLHAGADQREGVLLLQIWKLDE
jgi:hypothetical protein